MSRIDIDEIPIDEIWKEIAKRTYVKKNDEEHSVWIWTACIKQNDKKYYIYEVGRRDEETFLKSTG